MRTPVTTNGKQASNQSPEWNWTCLKHRKSVTSVRWLLTNLMKVNGPVMRFGHHGWGRVIMHLGALYFPGRSVTPESRNKSVLCPLIDTYREGEDPFGCLLDKCRAQTRQYLTRLAPLLAQSATRAHCNWLRHGKCIIQVSVATPPRTDDIGAGEGIFYTHLFESN